MLAILIILIIFAVIKLGANSFMASIYRRKKYIKRGILITLIPLLLLAGMLIFGGADFTIVMCCIVLPFSIPAIASGGFLGYLIGGAILKKKSEKSSYSRLACQYANDSYSYCSPGSLYDNTYKSLEEDPYGSMKDMIWKANNPQHRDLPEVRY